MNDEELEVCHVVFFEKRRDNLNKEERINNK